MEQKKYCKQQIVEMIMEIDDSDLIEYIHEYIRLLMQEVME